MRAGPLDERSVVYREPGVTASEAETARVETALCVDERIFGQGGTGVSTYARAVAAAQSVLADEALTLEAGSAGRRIGAAARIARYVRSAIPSGPRAVRTGHGRLVAPDLFRIAQIHFDLYGTMLTVRPPAGGGIMHWTYPLPIRLAGWRNVYTIHDAIPLLHPRLTSIDGRRHAALLSRVACSADGLVTVSDAARDDLAGALGIDAGRIVNCSQSADVAARLGILPAGLSPRGYLLVVGSVEPRKNIAATLHAYAASGVSMPLVVAGPAVAGAEALETLVASTPGAVRLPYLNRNAVDALLTGARALLMPSLAEGFGLPVAEAMTLGTPVITSNHGALAETAGDSAITVDPNDGQALAAAIRMISQDDEKWARLAGAGLRNATRFTPDRFAARLGRYYAGLIAGPGACL